MKALLVGCLIILTCIGCYRTSFYNDIDPLRPNYDGEMSHTSIVFAGIEIDSAAKLRTVCPSGVSKVEMKQSFTDGLIHFFTFSMYSSQTIQVWCKRRSHE